MKIIDLTAQRGELDVEIKEAIRDIDLEVPEAPAAATAPADAAPAAPGAPETPAAAPAAEDPA